MSVAAHVLLFTLSAAVIWFLSGLLIDATDRVAKRYKQPGFAVAFFVLGFLTSVSEISVATNATLEGVAPVSAGNLLGASTVIFLLIIPLLATLGNGVPMMRVVFPRTLAMTLFVVAVPALLCLDGSVARAEGVVMLLLYIALLYVIRKRRPTEEIAEEALEQTEEALLHGRHATLIDFCKIALGAVLIFVAGNLLVEESVYFATLLKIPVSFVGLLLLSIGTNIPELVIAIRCVVGKHKDIAFGDYLGSAAANTAIFGVLSLVNGTFRLESSEALLTFAVLAVGLVLFFFFARSKGTLSRREGMVLLGLYAVFLIFQISNAVRLSGDDERGSRLHSAAPELSVRGKR